MFVSRRLLIGVVLLALPLAALGAARSSSGAAPGARPAAGETYVVEAGDTLWEIAVEHLGGDPREAVWRITERNGLEGALIQPGDTLVLP